MSPRRRLPTPSPLPRRWLSLGAALAVPFFFTLSAGAEPSLVDRTVVRFDAPETGGAAHPQFVFEKELAFGARLEALADASRTDRSRPYLERHVRAALERLIGEELLAHLPMDPEPTDAEIQSRMAFSRTVLEQRVGGSEQLASAAQAEAIDPAEVGRVLLREARASLYLDRMVAPMLEPSEAELREFHRSTGSPFFGQRFEDVVEPLRRRYVADRLETAIANFYQNARTRVHLVVLR
jgi:hypothetical protein